MTIEKIQHLRDSGYTVQQIADMEGCSKQNISERLRTYRNKLQGARGKKFNINNIVYKGIYEHFKNDPKETITSFAEKIYGVKMNCTKTRGFITGKTETAFKLKYINRMCDICGTSFEETFELREVSL